MPDLNELNDKDLLPLLKAGDGAAFGEIYKRYWKQLFRTANNTLHDTDQAQDIIQNVFISLWNKRDTATIDSLKPYLHQATRYSVLKQIRDEKQHQGFYERLAAVTTEIIADNPLLFKEQQQLLQQLIETLPEECKEPFRLSREENMTYKQIAEYLGISEKTVEKRISKSLSHFRSGLTAGACVAIVSAISL